MRLEHRVKAKSQSSGIMEAAMRKEEGAGVDRMKHRDSKGLGKRHKGLKQGCSLGNEIEGKERSRLQRYINVNSTRLNDQFNEEAAGMVDEGFPSECWEAAAL